MPFLNLKKINTTNLSKNYNFVFATNEILLDTALKFLVFYSLFFVSSGISPSQIATLEIIEKTVSLIFEIPAGILADFFNKKTIINLGYLGVILAIVIFIFFRSFEAFVVAEILWGMGMSCISGTNIAWLSAKTSEKEANELSSHIPKFTSFTSIIAGLTGGLVSNYLGYGYAWGLLVVALSALLIFNIQNMEDDELKVRISWKEEIINIRTKLKKFFGKSNLEKSEYLKTRFEKNSKDIIKKETDELSTFEYLRTNLINNWRIGLHFFLIGTFFVPIFVFWQILVTNNFGWNLSFLGFVAGVIYVFVGAGSWIFSYLSKKNWKAESIEIFNSILMVVSSLLLVLATHLEFGSLINSIIFVLGMLGIEASLGLFFSSRNFLINQDLDESHRTSVLSMYNFIRIIGTIVGMLVFGKVADYYGLNNAFWVPVVFGILGLVNWIITKKTQQKTP